MAVNAFVSFFDKADGESIQKGKEKWIEIQGWDWEVEAETSWTKGGGASVGKPNPGKMNFEHYFDTSSTVILGYICTGKAFPKVRAADDEDDRQGQPRNLLHDDDGRRLHHQGVEHRHGRRQRRRRRSKWSSRP